MFPSRLRRWSINIEIAICKWEKKYMNADKIGANTASLADYSLYDAIAKLEEMNFTTIEFLAFAGARHSIGDVAGFWFDELSDAERNRLKTSVKSFKYVCIHAPFIDIPLFTHNPGVQRLAIAQIKEAIDATAFLDGTVTTIHVNPKTFFQLHETWDEMISVCRSLGDYAAPRGVKIGIETGFPLSVDDYVRLIMDIKHDAVGGTIDVGHLTSSVESELRRTAEGVNIYNDSLMRCITELGEKVYHFHIHDVRANDWRDHREVGAGIIDFERLMKIIVECNYDGFMTFELEEEDKEGALVRSKNHLCALLQGLHMLKGL